MVQIFCKNKSILIIYIYLTCFLTTQSALSSTHGSILIRPSKIEQTSVSGGNSTHKSTTTAIVSASSTFTSSSNSNFSNPLTNSMTMSTTTISSNSTTAAAAVSTSSSSSSVSPYIINLRTNQMIELTFPDEMSKTQWLTLVHTHVTPALEDTSNNSGSLLNGASKQPVTGSLSTPLQQSQFYSASAVNLHHQNSCASTTSNSSLMSSVSSSMSSTSSAVSIKNKSHSCSGTNQPPLPPAQQRATATLLTATPMNQTVHNGMGQTQSAVAAGHMPPPAMLPQAPASAPSVTINAQQQHRSSSNVSNNSSLSSTVNTTAKFSNSDSLNGIEPLNLTSDSSASSSANSSVGSPNTTTTASCAGGNSTNGMTEMSMSDEAAAAVAMSQQPFEMQLSPDLANIIYSFNYLIEQSLCQGIYLIFFYSI
jgi:hypothetical protein